MQFYKDTSTVAQEMLDDLFGLTGQRLQLTDINREEVIKILNYSGPISSFYAMLEQAHDDIWPASASVPGLINHLAQRELPTQAQPAPSTGTIEFTDSTPGTDVPLGTAITYNLNGNVYVSLADATVAEDGTVSIPFQSQQPGAAQDVSATGQAFSLVGSIPGLAATCTNTTQFADGRDLETGPEMLARIEEHDQKPNTGGNLVAYEEWAYAASGDVVTAHAIKTPRGPDTVDVVITSGTTDIPTAVQDNVPVVRIPSDELVDAVQAYIEGQDPTTDDVLVVTPTEEAFNTGFVYDLATGVDAGLRTQIDATINQVWQIWVYEAVPGETIYPGDLERLVDGAVGHMIASRKATFDGDVASFTPDESVLLKPGVLTTGAYS